MISKYEIIRRRMKGELFSEIADELNCTCKDISREISWILDSVSEHRFLLNFAMNSYE